jgi:hypothetical protein
MLFRRAQRPGAPGPPDEDDVGTPEDALEPALRLVLDAGGALAGAVCLFDPEAALLRLVAEVGLSEEGCRRLRMLRRRADCWQRPLDSLCEGRTLIDDGWGASSRWWSRPERSAASPVSRSIREFVRSRA